MNVISMFLVILPLLLKSNRLMFVKIAVFIILPILSLFLLSSSRLTNKVEIKSKMIFNYNCTTKYCSKSKME